MKGPSVPASCRCSVRFLINPIRLKFDPWIRAPPAFYFNPCTVLDRNKVADSWSDLTNALKQKSHVLSAAWLEIEENVLYWLVLRLCFVSPPASVCGERRRRRRHMRQSKKHKGRGRWQAALKQLSIYAELFLLRSAFYPDMPCNDLY